MSIALAYHPPTLLRRLAAASYDGFLLLALWMVGTLPLLLIYKGEAVPAGSWWYPLYLLGITGLFYTWFWTHGGQTLGMRAWRLRVIDEKGKLPDARQAMLRFVFAALAWGSVVGLLWCVVEPHGRAVHDLLSRTQVSHIPKS